MNAVELIMRDVVDAAERDSPDHCREGDLPLYGMVRYHLGWVDDRFREADSDPGKRVRPLVSLLTCGALGGEPRDVAPVAAAIELLHNFTLIHDDIQDRSAQRRGRETVWRNWGSSQAINAGDAMFALSQLALFRVSESGLPEGRLVPLIDRFNRTTLRIVEGQVLDLGFEDRWDISARDYIRMISGKTAAIIAFASWAGGWLAGHDDEVCERLAEFGACLGLGFQIRDDYLGVWGDPSETGKVFGDDIRRRKKAIPLIVLLGKLPDDERCWLRSRFEAAGALDDHDVQHVARLMSTCAVEEDVQALALKYHDRAGDLLYRVAEPSSYRDELERLLDRLATRER
jgi:geranylgeranyl diphosphate synthase, type I